MKYLSNLSIPVFFAILFCLTSCKNERKLPIYGEREAKTVKNEDGTTKTDSIYQTIPDFKFLNQDSVLITNAKFKDKIYIADFFFTSCSSICPVMHRNLKSIYDSYKDNPDIMYLSHTIDFKYDKPSVLKKYAQKLGVGPQWQFVYGPKEEIYGIAEKNYLVAVMEDKNDKDGYVHQGWLVLIDKDRRIRGAYDGTNPESVAQLTKDIPVLLAEYKK
jgi:protein SCO1/2